MVREEFYFAELVVLQVVLVQDTLIIIAAHLVQEICLIPHVQRIVAADQVHMYVHRMDARKLDN